MHVWGAFSAHGTFPIKIFTENLTGQLYCDILHECLVEQGSVLYPDEWVSKRTTAQNTHLKSPKDSCKIYISTIDWSACSPDMNPIGNIWSWIKRKIDLKSPRNLIELAEVLNDTWNSLEPEFSEPFWTSMYKRVKLALISSGGNEINYYIQ